MVRFHLFDLSHNQLQTNAINSIKRALLIQHYPVREMIQEQTQPPSYLTELPIGESGVSGGDSYSPGLRTATRKLVRRTEAAVCIKGCLRPWSQCVTSLVRCTELGERGGGV